METSGVSTYEGVRKDVLDTWACVKGFGARVKEAALGSGLDAVGNGGDSTIGYLVNLIHGLGGMEPGRSCG